MVKTKSTIHWKPFTLLAQLARDMAKPSCRNAGHAIMLLISLKLHTPIPGQSRRNTETNTTKLGDTLCQVCVQKARMVSRK